MSYLASFWSTWHVLSRKAIIIGHSESTTIAPEPPAGQEPDNPPPIR